MSARLSPEAQSGQEAVAGGTVWPEVVVLENGIWLAGMETGIGRIV